MNTVKEYLSKIEGSIHRNSGKNKVLLADNDRIWQERVAMLIESEADIDLSAIASTKDEANRASTQLDIDVVILDVVLKSSELDGLDVVTEILRYKTLPIIVLSSLHDPEDH